MESKQIQKAGDSSQQLQMVNPTFNVGITEKRAREIFSEMNEIARRDYTSDAYELALKRVTMFETLLMDKVQKVDGLLEAFGDPSFQYLLAEAQRRAAASERETDYAMLSELLGCRATQGTDRKIRAGISQAVKIVDEIDDDALCGLTVSYAVWRMYPLATSCLKGLEAIDDAFSSILYQSLPQGNEWLEHLEILNAVRLTTIAGLGKFETIYERQLEGYVCAGIRRDSEDYSSAMDIIRRFSLPVNMLIDHEWNDGYVRLAIPNIKYIDSIMVESPSGNSMRLLNSQEKLALRDIWDLYSTDSKLIAAVKKRFSEELSNRPHIAAVRNWWNKLPCAFNLTHVGIVLAHANAQKYNADIPDFFAL